MIVYVILSITILYFLFVLLKEFIYNITKIKICAICAAVSLTWIILIILQLIGYKVDLLILGILMGQSIAGVMYSTEGKIKNKLALSFVRLTIILIGTIIVYSILEVI